MFVEADIHKVACETSVLGSALSWQLMEKKKAAHGLSVTPTESLELGRQLQQALEQISAISTALCGIQLHYQDQVCADAVTQSQMGIHSG